jgi:hypothetical protein
MFDGDFYEGETEEEASRRRHHAAKSSQNEEGEFIRRGGRAAGNDRMREKLLLMEERQIRKDKKLKEKRESLLKEDRSVTIPSTTTVGRLATIFGLDLCESPLRAIRKQTAMAALTGSHGADPYAARGHASGESESRLPLVDRGSG